MIVFLGCGLITFFAAVLATFISDVRRAAISLWIASLALGGLCLGMGAELLAVTEWIVSTLVVISFIFYSVMFGEYGMTDRRVTSKKILAAVMPCLAGVAFAGMIWLGGRHLTGLNSIEPIQIPNVAKVEPASGEYVTILGKTLAEGHLLSLEVLALTLFLTVIGSGVIGRPEEEGS